VTAIELPAHAYIPGQNERHPEGAFDHIRQTAVSGQTAAELARSQAFLSGLQFIESGYYWEAHEVLESVWMVLPEDTIERSFIQGLIQLANGHLKLHMGRPKAALRLVGQARALVPTGALTSTIMMHDVSEVHRQIDNLESDIFLAL